MSLILKFRPVDCWSASDELNLVQILHAIGYEPSPSVEDESVIRRFKTQKVLDCNLWAESDSILEGLIPRLYCLFKFELKSDTAKVWRWTQVTGKLWFDPNNECF